uniref:Uncharacterized protein n=2 Tax=viral metagenome TaxID=1070528 RepID=A0A6M3JY07_9ZZZZ
MPYSDDTDFMTYYNPGAFPELQRYFFQGAAAKNGADFRLIEGMEMPDDFHYEPYYFDCYD